MAAGSKSNAPKPRKRVEASSSSASPASTTLVRNKDGSAFARCEECNKDVPMALINFHSCSLDAKIKMNLKATIVEKPPEVKKKPVERKKPTTTEPTPKRLKRLKKGTDSNAPKRPPTAFFVFMDEFRKLLKEANSNTKAGKEVSKEGGEKWKSMSDEEKKPYFDKAAELKAEYEKSLASNNEDNENENVGVRSEEDAEEEEKEAPAKEEEEVLDDY
ncbi:hypothetical protein SLE2022_052490 [Rubroshorea leprosula]